MRTLSLLGVVLIMMVGTSTTFAQSSIALNQDPEFNLLYSQSPLKQLKSGIASKDVKCHDNFLLTFKAKDGSPACVKPETAKILYERGWALVLSVNLNSRNSNQPVDLISILSDSSSEYLPKVNHMTYTKNNDPFGIIALVIYHPPDACLGPCPPNTFYLKTNSNSTAYLMGYNICDGDSCTKNDDLSILLPITDILKPDFKMILLPEDLHWKYGDAIHIEIKISSTADSKTALLIDYGNSTIVP